MKFKIFKDKRREWRFNGVARNGKVICTSEGYKSKQSAIKGINCIRNKAFYAEIE